VALVIVLMATMLLTALALSLVLVTSSETAITSNYRNSEETLYGADAAIELVLQDLLVVPLWNDVLRSTGNVQSSFVAASTTATLGDGTVIDVLKERSRLQSETDQQNLWGANNPVWRVYAFGPLSTLLAGGISTPVYVAVFLADDPSDGDGNPAADTNNVLTLHAEAWSIAGSHKIVEVAVSRGSTTVMERGQIAQRGQSEWNQRVRTATVQTPAQTIGRMRMSVASGTMVIQ
jgi:hypothetical protein